jgi:hypothetical protein
VELVNRDNGEPAADPRSRQIVSLPWSKKPSSAVKGIISISSAAAPADTKANAAILTTIAKAKRWVDALIDGASLAEIAKQEGKGERQIRLLIPLAFIPPIKLSQIGEGRPSPSLTDLARSVPMVWNG